MEVAILGSPSLRFVRSLSERVRVSELRSCVKVVEVDILGSPSLIVRSISMDVKQR